MTVQTSPAPLSDAEQRDAERDRSDRDEARLFRAVAILAPLVLALLLVALWAGWVEQYNAAASGAPTVAVAAATGPMASCGGDAECAAWQARQDRAAGRVPAVAYGPSPDGGVAVSCPDGWEVTGSSVLDSRCVPSSILLDA